MSSDITADLTLCDCCLIVLANDDHSGCDEPAGTDTHPEPVASFPAENLTPADTVAPCCSPDDDQDTGHRSASSFYASTCDGCGTRLAGTRHHAVVITQL
jgi:hypothetical protein